MSVEAVISSDIRRLLAAALACAAILLPAGADVAADGLSSSARKCESLKKSAVARSTSAILECYAAADGAGRLLDPACQDAARAALARTLAALDSAGGCAMEGDYSSRARKIQSLVGTLEFELGIPDGSTVPCRAAKWKATAAAARSAVDCYAAADAKGLPVDPTCLEKGMKPLASAFTAAEQKPGCEQPVSPDDVTAAIGDFGKTLQQGADVVAPGE
ncbi:MAG: hypothetical protein HY049_16560 [Acidobacteria bacterium]|nr:hypothetical protein [Acidobacteriota bacterium]